MFFTVNSSIVYFKIKYIYYIFLNHKTDLAGHSLWYKQQWNLWELFKAGKVSHKLHFGEQRSPPLGRKAMMTSWDCSLKWGHPSHHRAHWAFSWLPKIGKVFSACECPSKLQEVEAGSPGQSHVDGGNFWRWRLVGGLHAVEGMTWKVSECTEMDYWRIRSLLENFSKPWIDKHTAWQRLWGIRTQNRLCDWVSKERNQSPQDAGRVSFFLHLSEDGKVSQHSLQPGPLIPRRRQRRGWRVDVTLNTLFDGISLPK